LCNQYVLKRVSASIIAEAIRHRKVNVEAYFCNIAAYFL